MRSGGPSAGAKLALFLGLVLGGAGGGFVFGTAANVVAALPGLAGGGHAVGGARSNWIPPAVVAGSALGALLGAGLVMIPSGRTRRR